MKRLPKPSCGVWLDADIQSKIEKIQSDLAKEKEANRRHFTVATKLMDAFKDFDPKLKYAEQGGRTVGKLETGWINITPMPDWTEKRKAPRLKSRTKKK
jgi:hypothetical protein